MTGKKKPKYWMFILEAGLLLAALVLLLVFGAYDARQSTGTIPQSLKATPRPQEIKSPEPPDDGKGALVVIDASGLDDGGYFERLQEDINKDMGKRGRYIKVEPEALMEQFDALVSQGEMPSVVMGPEEIVGNLPGLSTIEGVYAQFYFNDAADRCVTGCTLPLALKMYGYYFRMDIMHGMRVYVPRSYSGISEAASAIAAKNGQLKAFSFIPGSGDCQLMLQQMASSSDADINSYINIITSMNAQGLLLLSAEDEQAQMQALKDGSAVMAFGSGAFYAQMLQDKSLRELVQVKPCLGQEQSWAAQVVSCAILSGSNYSAAQQYLTRLFREGIDDIVIERNPGYLNPGMDYRLDSPWSDALINGDKLIVYNSNMAYCRALMEQLDSKQGQ